MGLRDFLTNHLTDKRAEVATDVWPNPYRGDDGWEYRQLVLKQYLERSGTPRKRKDDHRYRSEDETRLDRAWVDVAEAVDRDPATVREVVLRMYDGDSGDHADVTHRFLDDLVTIEESLRER
jgi:hypothetical protein